MTSVRCTDAWEWTLLLGLKLRRELTELSCCISDSALFNDILYIRKTHTVRYLAAVLCSLEPFCSYDFITLPHWHSLETFRWQTIAWWFHSNELVNSTWLLKNYSNTVILSVWNAGKFLACCFGKENQALSFLQEYWCLKTVWYISVYSKLRCMFWLMSSFSFYSNIPAPLKCSAQIKTWKTPGHSDCPGYLKLLFSWLLANEKGGECTSPKVKRQVLKNAMWIMWNRICRMWEATRLSARQDFGIYPDRKFQLWNKVWIFEFFHFPLFMPWLCYMSFMLSISEYAIFLGTIIILYTVEPHYCV